MTADDLRAIVARTNHPVDSERETYPGRPWPGLDYKTALFADAMADRRELLAFVRRVADHLKVRYVFALPGPRGPEGPDWWVCDGCGATAETAGNGKGRAPTHWTTGTTPGTPDRQLPPVRPMQHAPDCLWVAAQGVRP